jgi:hypothetical protein
MASQFVRVCQPYKLSESQFDSHWTPVDHIGSIVFKDSGGAIAKDIGSL